MRPTDSLDKRILAFGTSVPKTGRVSAKKASVRRNASMKQSSAMKAGFRSTFELNLARALSEKGVSYEYETTKLTYIPKPRTYTPTSTSRRRTSTSKRRGTRQGRPYKMLLIKEQYLTSTYVSSSYERTTRFTKARKPPTLTGLPSTSSSGQRVRSRGVV